MWSYKLNRRNMKLMYNIPSLRERSVRSLTLSFRSCLFSASNTPTFVRSWSLLIVYFPELDESVLCWHNNTINALIYIENPILTDLYNHL